MRRVSFWAKMAGLVIVHLVATYVFIGVTLANAWEGASDTLGWCAVVGLYILVAPKLLFSQMPGVGHFPFFLIFNSVIWVGFAYALIRAWALVRRKLRAGSG